MLVGRSYKLLPAPEQEALLHEVGNVCRSVWNTALDQRRQAVARWQRGEQHPCCGYSLQAGELAEAKIELPWLTVRRRMCCSTPCGTSTGHAPPTAPSGCGGVPSAGGGRRFGSPTVPAFGWNVWA